ncbi:MAG: pyruvate, phosphate dikinase [Bacillota bacterium]
MGTKRVYGFREGNDSMRSVLGGKGAGLAEMTRIGLPVPPGFTITTATCMDYYREGKKLPQGLWEEVETYVKALEQETGKTFGGSKNPLLVSVRSGAVISMPGMMDTILNLGLNDTSVQGLVEATGDQRFALDCQRRFMQMFGDVVLGVDHDHFEHVLTAQREAEKVKYDYEISPEGLKKVIAGYRKVVKEQAGIEFPENPMDQLRMAIEAVFRSWNTERAVVYRKINKIPDDLGTAVNVQMMVFGNMGFDSGTGVMFTRNPSTGENVLYGEYLVNAQGEDVVAGIRTPKPISEMPNDLPETFEQIKQVAKTLEDHYRDMQDMEFTIEHGKLYMLQTRTGKRTAAASLEIARQMVHEGRISKTEALKRVKADEVARMLHRGVDPSAKTEVVGKGLPASPGAAIGAVVFDYKKAEKMGQEGEKVILVRPETKPEDMPGIVYAQGVLTSRGGMTCHAAVVARGMGKPAIVGCDALHLDLENRKATIGKASIKEGDVISIDGSTGNVFMGSVPLVEPTLSGAFEEILTWADEVRRLGVKANADTPADAEKARSLGAEGIGLTRTEHMFMQAERLPVVQDMIMAETVEERKAALDKLLPMQQGDFYGILKAMRGFPVTIRLLDPPLHEFLPSTEELAVRLVEMKHQKAPASEIAKVEETLAKARELHEANPMMGLRGCRLGVLWPEIYEMQARAIFQATAQLFKDGYTDVKPEVMIPLVGIEAEIEQNREMVVRVGEAVRKETGVDFPIVVGTMIEIPRAALIADDIAKWVEFFSFGTNDLTQMTFGYSRDDAEAKFLHAYLEKKFFKENPFQTLDRQGVGKLVDMAVKLGRQTRPDLVIGICGEHGGDPESVEFCHMVGLDYVSCSPFRVPVARLAAAHAALDHPEK